MFCNSVINEVELIRKKTINEVVIINLKKEWKYVRNQLKLGKYYFVLLF